MRGEGSVPGALTVLRAHDGRRLTKRFSPRQQRRGGGARLRQARSGSAPKRIRRRRHPRSAPDCCSSWSATPTPASSAARPRRAPHGAHAAQEGGERRRLRGDAAPLGHARHRRRRAAAAADAACWRTRRSAARVLLDVLAAHAPELEGVTRGGAVQRLRRPGRAGGRRAGGGLRHAARLERRRQARPPRACLVLAARAAGRGRAEAVARGVGAWRRQRWHAPRLCWFRRREQKPAWRPGSCG